MRSFTLVAVAAVAISGCQPADNIVSAPDQARPAKLYHVPNPGEQLMRRFPAKVQAAEQAALAFRVPGELQSLPAQPGQSVNRGDLLASLDPSDYRIKVNDRQARYELAKAQFDRIEGLYRQQQVSRSQFDQAKAELDISDAALQAAQTDLSYTRLKAPFKGEIAEVYTDNHQPVAAGRTVIMLQARDQLEVKIQVPENLMARIADSDRSATYNPEVEFEAIPGQRFIATYKEHTAQADPATGSFTTTLTLPRPPELNVLPGMSASVYVDLKQVLADQPTVLMVPSGAVVQHANQQEGSGEASVWVVSADMTLERRSVEVGRITSQGIEIQSGLQPGETILAAGVHQASVGMRVRPWVRERGL
ncbi:efflux transporter periplasmic adaptor subunit [Bacterioplanes sanyensis]|uniref:Efflux transporter periplasmic adaptor subunit n=1 Tax=Bacterioplanes sanyensis TaxID=1249553 RepID=A0A222FK67_9GAMM|nr:efflux RND transporter periplasmic adaptor subunit [Bacterioplanes sanyensis]ASP39437.1 efflux transporter periplasmic adaptor subunit [Bacterioplanes sanyensis]